MTNITRRKFLEVIAAGAAGMLALGIPNCQNGNETDKTPLEQRVGKQEAEKKAKTILNSQYFITNFGFSGNNVAYTIRKSTGDSIGDFVADEDSKVFSAPFNFVTTHYAEQEKNKSRVVLDAEDVIQAMYASPNGFYVVAGNKTKEYTKTPLEGLVKTEIDRKSDIPSDCYKGEYYSGTENLPKELNERYDIREDLNRKLGNIGINSGNQIRVTDKGEVQVVYMQEEKGNTPQETHYKLIVETLDRNKLGKEFYDKIVKAYSGK